MVLVLDKKPFEGTWWKYGLGLSVTQLLGWTLLGFSLSSQFSIVYAFRASYVVYGSFIVLAFLPFIAGRIGLQRLFWFSLIGFVLADLAYLLLASFEPVRRLNSSLPFIGFVQIATTMLLLGIIVEFGRYVYLKLLE